MAAKLLGRTKNKRANAVMSEINVTPMVDVMLVLLVIFMVTAPLLSAGVAIDLPQARAKAMSQKDDKPLEVSIDAKGNIFLGETKVTQERMVGMLQAIAKETSDRRVYIKASSKLDYGQVMKVMGAVSTSGFTKIALVTDPALAQTK